MCFGFVLLQYIFAVYVFVKPAAACDQIEHQRKFTHVWETLGYSAYQIMVFNVNTQVISEL